MANDTTSDAGGRRGFLTALGAGALGLCTLQLSCRREPGAGIAAVPVSGAGTVDVHHHVVPRDYVQALAALGIAESLGLPFPAWTVERDLEAMDQLGVRLAIASFSTPAASVPGGAEAGRALARRCNELLARLVADHPGRYGAFATVPPLTDLEGTLRELEYALDTLKLDGVELLTHYGPGYLGDAAFDEVFRALDARKAVVHVHPTDPPGAPPLLPAAVMEAPFDTTRAATSLICSGTMERSPGVTFILSHGGGTLPYLADRIGLAAPRLSRSFDSRAPQGFRAYLDRFWYDTALVGPGALALLVHQAGTGRVLAGTDHPFVPSEASAAALAAVRTTPGLEDGQRTAILGENAARLLARARRAR